MKNKYFLVCYETEEVNSVYLSTWVKHSINKSIYFFLLSEAVICLLFNDLRELTIDVHKYLDVLLACQNALSLDMPASITSKLSLIVIKDLFLVLLWWLFPSGVPVTACFKHCISKQKPRMDSFSYRLGYLKDFFQQESGCLPQEASVHLVKRCTIGFFSRVDILFLCLAHKIVSCKHWLNVMWPSEGRHQWVPEGGTYSAKEKRSVIPRILWHFSCAVQN